MGYKIFLSHSKADVQWVKWISQHAQAVGIAVYLYEHDPQPGRLIADKVKLAIQDSNALVVLLTANSQFSAYVQQEIGFAEASKKLIIPLVQPGIQTASLAMLEGRESVPFDFRNPQQALLKLLPYLQRLKQVKENQQVVLLGIGAIIALAWLFSGDK
jgi:hypothetical protein